MSREEPDLLGNEQAALRRVATLVARGTRRDELFTAGADEIGRLLPVDSQLWAATTVTVRGVVLCGCPARRWPT